MLIVPLNLPSVPVPVVPPHTASSSPSSAGKTRRDGPCERLNISDLPLKLGRIHDERLRRRPPASERPILPNAGPERLSDGRRAVRCGATVTRAAHRQPARRSGRGLYLPDVETTGLIIETRTGGCVWRREARHSRSEPMASTTRMAFARRVAARAENRAASEGSPLGQREARGERPWIKSVSRCL